jgi:hypothetical protein
VNRPPQAPYWLRRRRQGPRRCGACGREFRDGHGISCPTRFANLDSPEAIADARAVLIELAGAQEHITPVMSPAIRAVADGVTARAVELGFERW